MSTRIFYQSVSEAYHTADATRYRPEQEVGEPRPSLGGTIAFCTSQEEKKDAGSIWIYVLGKLGN
jgi:hypothetical protein